MKPPSRLVLCEWVKAAWDAIPVEAIKKSFLSCAITTSVDGHDDEIHCFNLVNHAKMVELLWNKKCFI